MKHVALDIRTDEGILTSTTKAAQLLVELANSTGMEIKAGPTVISFGEGLGVSGFVIIAESHISIHTWPENRRAYIDLFSCREFNVGVMQKVTWLHSHYWGCGLRYIIRERLDGDEEEEDWTRSSSRSISDATTPNAPAWKRVLARGVTLISKLLNLGGWME